MAQHIYSVRLFNGTVIGDRLLCMDCMNVSFPIIFNNNLYSKGKEL
ncbi:MAG: hypothetical protein Q8S01_04750 [Ignavibacteria bacterium]|nr:hypothetical protein [Ignavibacteria bacterium]